MSFAKHPHTECPTTTAGIGRRLVLLGTLSAPFVRSHAAGIRIVHSEVAQPVQPGALRKILVLGWGARQDLRRIFEDSAAQELQVLGVAADASHKFLTAGEAQLRDAVTRVVRAQGFDAVIVARLIATERATPASAPARAPAFEPTLDGNLSRLEASTSKSEDGLVAVTETSLYRVADRARLWSALTDVQDPKDTAQTTRDYARIVISEMRRQKLV